MLLTDENTLPEYVFTGKKFIRREDLTESIRSYIAVRGFLAKQNSQYGIITNLSRQFNISRSFVYDAISSLEEVLSIIFNKSSSEINPVDEKDVLHDMIHGSLQSSPGRAELFFPYKPAWPEHDMAPGHNEK